MFPPGVPIPIYLLLTPIELLQVVVIRPFTLSVRLFANMVAGHFLLAVFFLGSLALVTGVPVLLGVVSFGMGMVMMGSRSSYRACKRSSSPCSPPPTSRGPGGGALRRRRSWSERS